MKFHQLRLWYFAAAVSLVAAVGLALGFSAYTFHYARGSSYLSNDPRACANCHVMEDHYAAWSRSGHHHVAVCNDCHAPADFIGKWSVKAENGFWHSFAFTTGRFPDPIQIKQKNLNVAEASCRRCHGEMVHSIDGVAGATVSCTHCHQGVGHGILR